MSDKSASRIFLEEQARLALHTLLRTASGKERKSPAQPPKRILLLNGAHLGDVVISTSLLPVLKSAYPLAQIGFVAAGWSHPVIRDHPLISYTHRIDDYRLNREDITRFKKLRRYWQTRHQALKEIRALSYDVAVCLHPWRPDFLPLAWQADIPVRAAFSRSLFAPLATVTAEYPELLRLVHQGECQADLLRALGIEEKHLALRKASLAPSTASSIAEAGSVLGIPNLHRAGYTIIHTGSGAPAKEVPPALWRELASQLATDNLVVFTGKGARESSRISAITEGLPNCIDACGKLSWQGFVAAVRHARTLYGVDSMAAHVAAAVGTPCVALYGGMNNIARWRPDGPNCTVWSNPVPCSPCGRFHGCPEMTCMQSFVPADILASARPADVQPARVEAAAAARA